jgi:isocitrate dehydrogenase
VDIGMARIAASPQKFDVVVTSNLYGDIVSDIAAEVSGSVGLAGSANIGSHCAMFEAIHGSAPDIAGKGIANPSGLLLSGVMMLVHIGQPKVAEAIHNAWLRTIEDGIHTADIFREGVSKERASTNDFAEAVIARLGMEPATFEPVRYAETEKPISLAEPERAKPARKSIVGVDVFVHWAGVDANELAGRLAQASDGALNLAMITNRGVKVWPNGLPETFLTDHWRCRFEGANGSAIDHKAIAGLQLRLAEAGVDFIKTEHLCTFDGERGFSLGQGQ